MQEANIFIEICVLIITGYIAFIKKFAVSYVTEKGKNLATKEDVEEITRKIESVKSQFDLSKITYQIRFNKLHERRAVVIEEFFGKLARLQVAMEAVTAQVKMTNSGTQEGWQKEEDERKSETVESYNDFNKYYIQKKIFFTEEERIIIERIRKEYVERLNDYWDRERMWSQKLDPREDYMQEVGRKATEASKFIANEIPKILQLLETEFQKFYGMKD